MGSLCATPTGWEGEHAGHPSDLSPFSLNKYLLGIICVLSPRPRSEQNQGFLVLKLQWGEKNNNVINKKMVQQKVK